MAFSRISRHSGQEFGKRARGCATFGGDNTVQEASQDMGAAGLSLTRTLVLVGMMGAGKTAIGRAFAARFDLPFLDSDAEIVEAAQASIAEIFARDGEAFFRKREAEVIARLLAGPICVLSTGGGAYLAAENRAILAQQAVVVWLDAPLDLLWDRVRHKDTRPLLQTDDPRATLTQIYHDRTPLYQQAELRLPVQAGASIDETTDQVVALLRDAGYLQEITA